MTDLQPGDPRHPRLQMHGPKAAVPVGAQAGELPYAGGSGGGRSGAKRVALVVTVVAVLAGAAVVALLVTGEDEPSSDRATGQPAATSGPATGSPDGTSTTALRSTTTTATTIPASTTTVAPATTTTRAATADIPVDQLPRHEAVYRDGKLVLQGTVPSAEIRERFRTEAAEVIGAENVLVRYQIDPRVPVPTDGRVRVDEDFLFAKNSAEIDARYEPLLQLGVTVMRINPQARMRITGYTDTSGSAEVNQRLSQDRAEALVGYLVSNGIAAPRLEAVGKGPADPVAPNDTEANRAQNRRIEVELFDLLKE